MAVITVNQLNTILTECRFEEVSSDVSSVVVKQINNMTHNLREAAMFVAQLIQESDGFQRREDLDGGKDQPDGKIYYGRGYIQITGEDDYKAASNAIYEDEPKCLRYDPDLLVKEPHLVSATPKMSMRVSVWFWETKVRETAGLFNDFHATTTVINGGLEPDPEHPKEKKRYEYYLKAANVLEEFG